MAHGVPAEGRGQGGEAEGRDESDGGVGCAGGAVDGSLSEEHEAGHAEPDDGAGGPDGVGAAELLRDGSHEASGEDGEDGFDEGGVQGFVGAGADISDEEEASAEESADGGGFPAPGRYERGARVPDEIEQSGTEVRAGGGGRRWGGGGHGEGLVEHKSGCGVGVV